MKSDEAKRRERFGRYATLCRDVLATLGFEAGLRWLGKHKNLAKASIARLEQVWAIDKHRHQEKENARERADDGFEHPVI